MRRDLLGWLCLLVLAAAPAVAQTSYTVMTAGRTSGTMRVSGDAEARRIDYAYVDRGRGPDVSSAVTLDSAAMPVAVRVDGVDYYKRMVVERFERGGTSATWRAANDGGTSTRGGFYFPAEANPEHVAMLARALLRAPGGSLPLLPSGLALIEHLTDRQVSVAGAPRRARLYAISGLGFDTRPIWLDDEGELLFEGSRWVATVRAGLEPEATALIAAQAEVLDARDMARARSLGQRTPGVTAFQGVGLFDAEARTVRPDMTVLVENGRIVAVGPAQSMPVPQGAEIIAGQGRTLLPGLWDMHVHVSANYQGLMHLAAGVTSVRDLGNDVDEILARRRRFDSGDLAGPRIILGGFIDGPGQLAGPFNVLASAPDQLRAHIGDYARRGYRQIKLYSSLDPALVPVAADEAHRLGLRLSGHVPARMTMEEAVRAGYDEIHHLNFAALNFMGPDINSRTNGVTRITAIAEHAWELDLDSPAFAQFIDLLRTRGTVVDPTSSLYENHLTGRPGRPAPTLAGIIDLLPPGPRRGSFGAGLAQNDAEAARNARSFARMQEVLRRLHAAGVTMVPGTDAMPGFTLQRELELYAEAGIPAGDVLYMATLGAARVAGQESELGSIAAGKRADLILVEGNPLQSLPAIRNLRLVMKDGIRFDPAILWQEVGVSPAGPAR